MIIWTVDEGESWTLKSSQVVFISNYIWLKYLAESKYFSEISASPPNRSFYLGFDWNIFLDPATIEFQPILPCHETGEEEEEKAGRPTHLWYVDWCGRWTKVTWETQTSPASTRGGWLDNRQVALAVAVALFLSHLDLKHRITPSQISN